MNSGTTGKKCINFFRVYFMTDNLKSNNYYILEE